MKRAALIACLVLPALAQDEPRPTPVTVEKEVRHEVQLRSRSVLVGRLEPEIWKVETAFGQLKVPVHEIRHVRFGRKADAARLERIAKAIEDLASANPERRNHARAELKEEGPFAALDLKRAAKDHADPEVRRVCKELLEELDLDDDEILQDEDVIETTLFSVAGAVSPESFKVGVPELGAVSVRRKDILYIRAFKPTRAVKTTVGGANMWPNGWVDTGVKVVKGKRLVVTATGTIHFPNWGGQVTTPDGNRNMGMIQGMFGGALAGRIGKNGQVFRVGSNYNGKANASGTLHVCVMLQIRGQPSTGEYEVRINLSPNG